MNHLSVCTTLAIIIVSVAQSSSIIISINGCYQPHEPLFFLFQLKYLLRFEHWWHCGWGQCAMQQQKGGERKLENTLKWIIGLTSSSCHNTATFQLVLQIAHTECGLETPDDSSLSSPLSFSPPSLFLSVSLSPPLPPCSHRRAQNKKANPPHSCCTVCSRRHLAYSVS